MSHQIGPHSVEQEGDLVTVRLHGELSASEMRELLGFLDGVIARHGWFGFIGDVTGMTSMSAAARRLAGSWTNVDHTYGSAVFGASFPIRTMLTLLARGMELFRPRNHNMVTEFFKTEAEARAWLVRRREEKRAP